MAKKRTYREFKQGEFKPVNRLKCLNRDAIIYRSGLELSLMIILDKNPNILEWNSEGHIIQYIKPTTNRPARYFVDFYVKIKIGNRIQKLLIEVKPDKQTRPVKEHGNAKASTILYSQLEYAINTAKWEAAKKWCQQQGDYEFHIITEKNIHYLQSTG